MAQVRNILFIMCDQLRWDHLSCYGHPRLGTPNIDALAARGVRFDRAYVQSPICGASRMSTYTGRYVHSHGASWNFVPLKAGEMTIGDHLRPLGVRSVLVGKTHMRADTIGMARLGIDPHSEIGVRISECGFDSYERDDGLHPYSGHDPNPPYDEYLRRHGFDGENPWEEWANAAAGENGELLSGWFLKNATRPARVPDEHSETPYITRRAMDFISEAGPQPWCLHLSYIKPHWPYIVPEPYASMYTPADVLPVVRDVRETTDPHPIYRAFMNHRVSRAFSRNEVRDAVMPAYMGLIKQIDDQMGVLFSFLETRGLMENTMIVFTSDHGDYLGDHWLGDKDLFHEPSVRVPLIIYDPDGRADASRGSAVRDLVEAIDLAATFIDAYGGAQIPHILDGRSLRPLLFGQSDLDWRRYVISEYDYSFTDTRIELGTKSRDAWLRMIFDGRYKYIFAEGYRPMLYDLEQDPQEFFDRGDDPALAAVRTRLHDALFQWARQPRQRTTIADGQIEGAPIQQRIAQAGILIGFWDQNELAQVIQSFQPTLAAHNPLAQATLNRLVTTPAATPRRAPRTERE
jgi:arylsulfatase A-like enzyme